MKKVILLTIIFFYSNLFSQKSEFEDDFINLKAEADSNGLRNEDVDRNIFILENLKFFKDKLLLSDNYKNKEKVRYFLKEYKIFLPNDFNENQISNPILINNFYRDQEDLYYAKSSLLLARLMTEKTSKDVERTENDLIKFLQDANYPIEKYNKLTDIEQSQILNNIKKGYKYK